MSKKRLLERKNPSGDYVLKNEDYRRMLDSMARFYNSEITQHVGYLLTSAVAPIAGFSLLQGGVVDGLSWFFGVFCRFDDWVASALAFVMTWIVFGLVYVAYLFLQRPYPVLPSYLMGRTQYYIVLSEIVWEHMGLKGENLREFRQMKDRAFRKDRGVPRKNWGEGSPVGIEQAIMSTFEARLYVSVSRQIQKTPAESKPKLPKGWRDAFYLQDGDEIVCDNREERGYYAYRRILAVPSLLGRWNMTRLLVLAYRSALEKQINRFTTATKQAKTDQELDEEEHRGKLWSQIL